MGIPNVSLMLAIAYLRTGEKVESVISIYLPKEIAGDYSRAYFKEVKKALKNIINSEPMYDERISLRNIAEMTVRYEKTTKNIEELKKNGVNLVVSSKHSNCSKRCEPWQGGHYTLDNTYQVVDGIEFQPLQNATDQFYTTKAGKVYKNGHITGFNCRHYLIPYKTGLKLPYISAKEVERERNIDHNMRYLERQVRKWKETAIIYKGVSQDEYLKARAKAKFYYKEYKDYAKENGRKYYQTRTEVL